MDYGYKTDTGKMRENNEDRYLFVNEDDYVVLAVADGMGGHNAGDIASTLAIDEIVKYNLNTGFLEDTEERLKECVKIANEKIFEYSKGNLNLSGMGTTLVIAVVIKDNVYIANVGDSRAYLIGKTIKKLTVDHSYVEELKMMGRLTEEEAKTHPGRNHITRAVGTEKEVKADTYTVKKKNTDVILLCSDGLTGMVSEKEIFDTVKNESTLQSATDALILLANKNGGRDNITVVGYVEKEEGR